jgi:hypothetical protein
LARLASHASDFRSNATVLSGLSSSSAHGMMISKNSVIAKTMTEPARAAVEDFPAIRLCSAAI